MVLKFSNMGTMIIIDNVVRGGKLVEPGYPNPQAEEVKKTFEILPVKYMILGAGEMSYLSIVWPKEKTDLSNFGPQVHKIIVSFSPSRTQLSAPLRSFVRS